MMRKLKLTGLAAAAIMTISAVSLPIQAASNACNHPALIRIDKDTYANYATPQYHTVYLKYEYKCTTCNNVIYTGEDCCGQEEHDYCNYDPSTGKFKCRCGDYF